eukprot:CAMPEP_0206179882 /NCGR_PEP_ID=MMETSP1474-20131121/67566_1 /ASSEMBLY_ACC=CAM_ASM_001110 /TAXON_ID=97495 /ORGANISM="Imantonia sp., Strain RCC918" /LENGTH=369 /DNA_ID=CAMNT_0053593213 /DNA_START=354 /DNA_END=1459 /DNA_ORIENTATION=-
MIQSIKDKELEEKRRKEEYERQLRLQREAEEAARREAERRRLEEIQRQQQEARLREVEELSRKLQEQRDSIKRGIEQIEILDRSMAIGRRKGSFFSKFSMGKSSKVDKSRNIEVPLCGNRANRPLPATRLAIDERDFGKESFGGYIIESMPVEQNLISEISSLQKSSIPEIPNDIDCLFDGDSPDNGENIQESKNEEHEEVQEEDNEDLKDGPKEYQSESNEDLIDFTKIPSKLDSQFELLDTSNSLHTTIVKVASNWEMKFQKTLLGSKKSKSLNDESLKEERDRAFDLLDCLTKSGELKVCQSEFHVVLVSSYCFDKSVLNSLCQDNLNPIEELERSTLIVASTLFDKPTQDLIEEDKVEQVKLHSP